MTVRLDEAQRALAAAHVRLAESLARRYARRAWLDPAELMGAAYVGLCEGALTYRPDRGCPLRTHLYLYVRGRVVNELEWWYRPWRRWRQIDQDMLRRVWEQAEPPEPDGDETGRLWEACEHLSPAHHTLIYQVLFLGEPISTIAAGRGVSREAVSRQYHRALDRLRDVAR